MVFVEARFFLFFAIVLILYWSLKSNNHRKILILISSYFFYGSWDWRFLFLIIASTVVDYFAALYINRAEIQSYRRVALWSSIAFNLGVLGVFKYFGFFSSSFSHLLGTFGITVDPTTLNIVLPIGISFYTFQTMSYTIDVYRRRLKARTSILDVAVFVAFFPQLVAGPIVRAGYFLPQLDNPRRFADVNASLSILLCLVGYFKKAVVADNIAPFIDPIWADPLAYDWLTIVAAQFLFLVQIYCDFSGYADIAVGTAGLLGYSLPRNFNAPYLARNVSEAWRRWHMTLSSWFRDYVFLPLVRRRRQILIIAGYLVLVMGLVGLWHGANWTFIIWGALQGVALGALAIAVRTGVSKYWAWMPVPLAVALTFIFDAVTIVFFRAADVSTALQIVAADFAGSPGTLTLGIAPFVAFAGLALIHWIWQRFGLERRLSEAPSYALSIGYGAGFAFCFALTPREILPFIYFQF